MDASRFDALVRTFTSAGSRRRLLGVLAALPLGGGVARLLGDQEAEGQGRRKRRKKAHKHGRGRRRTHGRAKCKAEPRATVCANRCGPVRNNCAKTIDCGSCACDSPCPICQTCQESPGRPGVCVPDPAVLGDDCGVCRTCDASGACAVVPNGTACDDDDACTQTDTCQGGVCTGGDPIVCNICQLADSCDPNTGQCQPDPAKRHACGVCAESDEWCDAGACAGIQATVTVIDCGSKCTEGSDVATAELCGQNVTCPTCTPNCINQTGCTENPLFDGPVGPGWYCSTTGLFAGGGQPCTSNANCPSDLYCADIASDRCARICPY